MTPLEEIEEAIEYVRQESDEYRRLELLAPMFQARAVERLCEIITRTVPPAPNVPHKFSPIRPKSAQCGICSQGEFHPLHLNWGDL